jgi:hypothetical protein
MEQAAQQQSNPEAAPEFQQIVAKVLVKGEIDQQEG